MNFVKPTELWQHPQYEKINEAVAELGRHNLLNSGAGFCYAMADLVSQRLKAFGIKTSIVECEATLVCSDPVNFVTIGHKESFPNQPNRVASHVIVLVHDNRYPLIIDCSISHILPDPFRWVCGPAQHDEVIGEFERDTWKLTYRQRIGSRFPELHEKNIVDRLELDRKIQENLQTFKTFRKIVLGMMLAIAALMALTIYTNIASMERHAQNSERIHSLDEKVNDSVERIRSYRDQLMNLQNALIQQKK